jgi:hypothetical protein
MLTFLIYYFNVNTLIYFFILGETESNAIRGRMEWEALETQGRTAEISMENKPDASICRKSSLKISSPESKPRWLSLHVSLAVFNPRS